MFHRVSDAIQPSCPLLSPLPDDFSLSQHQVFFNVSVLCIRWPRYWSYSFSISPYNEYSRLISFRMDWLNLLAVQGTLKSLLQHHSSKASILLINHCHVPVKPEEGFSVLLYTEPKAVIANSFIQNIFVSCPIPGTAYSCP